MMDQIHMKSNAHILWNNCFKGVVISFAPHRFLNAKPGKDPMNVGIHGESFTV